jgi:cytochrome c
MILRYTFICSLAIALSASGILLVRQTQAAPAPDGAVLYKQRCQMCHLPPPKQGTLGPSLAGVIGRKAGTGTFNYSPAMRKSGLTWTATNLDKFVANPRLLVPGTKMTIAVSNPKERAAIIKYISKLD